MKQLSPVGEALMQELKKKYTAIVILLLVVYAKTEENRKIMLTFIEMAKSIGDEVTHDDMLKLAVILKNRSTD